MRVRLVAVVCSLLVLAGCSGGAISGLDETAVAGAQFTGVVHGGQQPIVGAKIFLLAANTTGYGGNGIAASASNASISLLKSAANATQDTNSSDPTKTIRIERSQSVRRTCPSAARADDRMSRSPA